MGAVRLSIQQIGRSRLFVGLNSQLSTGMGEDEGLWKTASELPSNRELNLLESRFFSVSFSSSSGSWLSPVGFLPGLRPRAPRVLKEERDPSPFHPEEGEDSASKKKLSFRVKDRFRLRLFSPSSSLMGD